MGCKTWLVLSGSVLWAGCDGQILGPAAGSGLGGSPTVTTRAPGSAGTGGGSGSTSTGGTEDGAALYTASCAACHGPLATSTRLGVTATQIQMAIASIMQMQTLQGKLSVADIAAIAAALQAAAPPPPSMTDAPAQVHLTVGHADFLTSQFTAMFVSSANTTGDQAVAAKISALVSGQVASIGGSCLRYDPSCPGEGTTDGDEYRTNVYFDNHDQSAIAFDPISNAMRKGYLVRACRELLDIDTSVTNALAKASLTTASPGNAASMAALYGQFFPGSIIPPDVSTGLTSGFTAAQSSGATSLDSWRFLLLTLCTADEMETL